MLKTDVATIMSRSHSALKPHREASSITVLMLKLNLTSEGCKGGKVSQSVPPFGFSVSSYSCSAKITSKTQVKPTLKHNLDCFLL